MGEFQGAPIDELSIFSDGIVVKGRTDSDNLDAIIDDAFAFAKENGYGVGVLPLGHRFPRSSPSSVKI